MTLKDVNWADLQYFLAIAETGTLAAAANRLGTSQATVWRRIRSLQNALGVALFAETNSGHVLSAAGLELMAAIGQIEQDLTTVLNRLTSTPISLRGTVRVTAPEFIGSHLIAPQLPDLLNEHPHLTLELLLASPTVNLVERHTDIAILPQQNIPTRFHKASTFELPFGLYASASYVQRYGRPASIDGLSGHCLVDFEESAGHVAPELWHQRSPANLSVTFRSSSPHARLAAVRAGVGLGLFPCCLTEQESLTCLLEPDVVGSLTLVLLIHPSMVKDAKVRAIATFLTAILHSNSRYSQGCKEDRP